MCDKALDVYKNVPWHNITVNYNITLHKKHTKYLIIYKSSILTEKIIHQINTLSSRTGGMKSGLSPKVLLQ